MSTKNAMRKLKRLLPLSILFLLLLVSCENPDKNVFQGYIEGEYTHLSSSIGGPLQKLYVARGQTVTARQRLFDLDPEPEAAEYRRAVSNLESETFKLKDFILGQRPTVLAGIIAQREQAQANLALSKNNFERTCKLYQKGVVSKANYDEALAACQADQQKVSQFEQNLREAELGERQFRILQQTEQVKAAKAALEEAAWRLAQKSGRAPEGGFIYDVLFNEGEQVAAYQPIVSLLSPDHVYVIFYIPEPLRAKIAINDKIRFDCAGCPKYDAFVNYISSQAEYTPPVIFSRESKSKLVYRIQAKLPLTTATKVYPGQPIAVYIPRRIIENSSFWNFLWNLKKKLLTLIT
jgi:HlyD family secretion protein